MHINLLQRLSYSYSNRHSEMFLRILLIVALVSVLVLFLAALNYEVLIHRTVSGDQGSAKSIQNLNNFSFERNVPFALNNETTALRPIQPLLIQRLGSIRVSNATDFEEATLSIGGITKINTTPRPIATPKQANNPATCGQTQFGFTSIGQAAHLNSLNFPNSYPLNLDCSYLLTSPVNTRMTVRCDTFNVPCATDTFYYSLDSGNKYFGYCGQGIVKPMTTKGNRLNVMFHSGSQRPNSQAKTRFQCKITVIGPGTPVPSTNCSCGVRNVDGANRIVGGTPTKAGEIPWRVGVFIYEIATQFGEICGGAIINQNWILTAAHCTQNFQDGYQINVYPGAQANPVTTGGVDPIVVDRYIQHPDYNRITLDNDICLLHLSTPLTYRASISPVCLPYPLVNFNLSGTTALASGFGTTQAVASGEDGGPVSNTLLKVELPMLTTTECSKYQRVTNNMICTYLPGKDTCQGDSGGSLDYKYKNDRYYAVGIVSHGVGCGQSDYPGVYTKVTNYLNWIQTATKETFCQA